jgi:hypothetical protein
MTQPPRKLEDLQRWMQSVITHPDGIVAGVESLDAQQQIDVSAADLESVIPRSQARTSVQRLAVYGNAYFSRLLECMRELFPALAHALGEELFDGFALEYLQKYPSRSYTLDQLADRFVQFLEETRPDATEASWPDFIIDLARFEWAIDDVFDGPGVENEQLLTAEQLQAIPPQRWSDARLVPVVCLRPLAFKYPVNDYYTAFRRDEKPPLPEPAETFTALSRRDYIVRRYKLSRLQYVLLSALAAGDSVGDAIAQCAESCDDLDSLAADLQDWFRLWAADGFFRRVELPE